MRKHKHGHSQHFNDVLFATTLQLLTLNLVRSHDNVVKISPRIDRWFRATIDALNTSHFAFHKFPVIINNSCPFPSTAAYTESANSSCVLPSLNIILLVLVQTFYGLVSFLLASLSLPIYA